MTTGIRKGAALASGVSPARLARLGTYLDRLLADRRIPHYAISIERHGRTVMETCGGTLGAASSRPVTPQTMFRIYSMTKPVVAVAALSMFEEAAFQLDQPVHTILPEFADMTVYCGNGFAREDCRPATRPVTIHDLLTHTSGLTGHRNMGELEAHYDALGLRSVDSRITLGETVTRLADLPLSFDPGQRWKYGLSTDVLGRVLEVVAGQPLDQVLQTRVFDPLGMSDTGFFVAEAAQDRFAQGCQPDADGRAVPLADAWPGQFLERPVYLGGGGGLVSSLGDYRRFTDFLRGLNRGGAEPILSRKSIELMTRNHLSGDIAAMGQPSFVETSTEGVGFGLGLAVLIGPIEAKNIGSAGEFGWGGLASTFFFVDPVEELSLVFMTQLAPSSALAIRRPIRTLIYQSLQ